MCLKEPKISFIEEAQYRGKSTPTHYSINLSNVLKRSQATVIKPSKDAPGEKIKHEFSKNPAPGHYNADDSFDKT